MPACLRVAVAALPLLAAAWPGSGLAQMGDRPNPALAECSRLQGVLYGGVDVRRLFRAPSGDFSVLLPGRDWCEILSEATVPYTFMGLRLLAQSRWSRPDTRPEDAAMVRLQVLPLPWPVGQVIPTPEALREAILALRRGDAVPPALQGVTGLIEDQARAPGLDMTIVEGGARCLRLRTAQDLPAATSPRPAPRRRQETETRLCFGAGGGAAAFVGVVTTVPVPDRIGAEAVASIRERVLASVHFEPLSVGVSPDCRPAQEHFAKLLPRCAAVVDVVPEPGASGAAEAAMGCLAGAMANSGMPRGLQQRCFAEVLRDAGFRDALPLDLMQRLRRAQDR